jgi:hypothetical protein
MNRAIAAVLLAGSIAICLPTGVFAQGGGGKGSPMSAPTAPSPMMASCTVKSVDANAMTFNCGRVVYEVTTNTVFQLGSAGTSFSNLTVGMAVTVTYQSSGSNNVAASVTSP